MFVERLEVRNVRNLEHVVTHFSPKLNVVVGRNGSGKTSLLEAVHLLATAKSFRTGRIPELVRHQEAEATVFGIVQDGRAHRVGIRKHVKEGTAIQVDGVRVQNSSAIATLIPLQVITPQSHELISGGPALRRAFLDWILFHVEPMFLGTWQRYERGLRQRNAALREGGDLAPWDRALSESGERLEQMRGALAHDLVAAVVPYVTELLPDLTLGFVYRRGWRSEVSLSDALAANVGRDRKLGYTSAGPHRSDLIVTVGGQPAASVLSRGQEKLTVAALRVAQIGLISAQRQKDAILLIDDLAAELDADHRGRLLGMVQRLPAQVFITTTDAGSIDLSPWSERRMFHVEQGRIQEML